ncbi:hypothetical protein BDZ88DRAFT_427023 [Geranomyces variabilis]|nr:hypothetical protein BDZ88DRAFT_427023 [Geranomyces variabilis]
MSFSLCAPRRSSIVIVAPSILPIPVVSSAGSPTRAATSRPAAVKTSSAEAAPPAATSTAAPAPQAQSTRPAEPSPVAPPVPVTTTTKRPTAATTTSPAVPSTLAQKCPTCRSSGAINVCDDSAACISTGKLRKGNQCACSYGYKAAKGENQWRLKNDANVYVAPGVECGTRCLGKGASRCAEVPIRTCA